MVMHPNANGYADEDIDVPIPGCFCNICEALEAELSGDWQAGGSVSGQPAKTKQTGARVEALWGGTHPDGDGDGHGHIVSNDGVNADYVRYPGERPIVNNRRPRQ